MRELPSTDAALLSVAVILMLVGAVLLVGGWVPAGITIPAIAIGIALVVIEQRRVHRRHASLRGA